MTVNSSKKIQNITRQELKITTSISQSSGAGLVLQLPNQSLSLSLRKILFLLFNPKKFRFGSLETTAVNKDGWMLGYWNSGMMAYTSVILCVNLKILLFSNTYNLLVVLGIATSVVTYVYSFKISSLIESSPDYSEYDL